MKKMLIVSVIATFILLTISAGAFAGGKNMRLSVNAGMQMPTDNFESKITIGANLGFMLSKSLELTAGISLFSTEDDIIGILDLNETHFLAGAYMHLGEKGKMNPKLGAGIDFCSVEFITSTNSDSTLGFWFSGGLDFPMGDNLFLGAEVRYLISSFDMTTGGTLDTGGLQLLAVVGLYL